MSKYRNKKNVYQGKKFDSVKERNRYIVLQSWEKAGLISDLRLQVRFDLIKGVKIAGEPKKRATVYYVADFTYQKNGLYVVEDVKSVATRKNPIYRLKKHLMKVVHNIDVVEV